MGDENLIKSGTESLGTNPRTHLFICMEINMNERVSCK